MPLQVWPARRKPSQFPALLCPSSHLTPRTASAHNPANHAHVHPPARVMNFVGWPPSKERLMCFPKYFRSAVLGLLVVVAWIGGSAQTGNLVTNDDNRAGNTATYYQLDANGL